MSLWDVVGEEDGGGDGCCKKKSGGHKNYIFYLHTNIYSLEELYATAHTQTHPRMISFMRQSHDLNKEPVHHSPPTPP